MYEIKSDWVVLLFAGFVVWVLFVASIKVTIMICVVCWLLFGCGIIPESWYKKIGNKIEK